MRIAVLVACYNRRETTLKCFRSLPARLDVYLVDDACTDGTADAVRKEFPFVKILQTEGNCYWARGMEFAWREAAKGDYDAYLWLNDDTELNPDALSTLLHFYTVYPDAVINGTLVNAKGEAVYGYNVRNTGLSGNCVLVPRKVYEQVGIICGMFAHGWADRDYGLRVERAGFRIVSAGVVGRTEWHPNRPSLKGVGFRGRCRMLRDPKGWNVHDLWLLRVRNWGICAAIWSCAHLICHVLKGEDKR